MRMICLPSTGRSAISRRSTQSKPLTLGERAQPGRPSTGRSPMRPSSSRLPGSTGMPKWRTSPPQAVIAAGITSRRSVMAEAPAMSSISGAVHRPDGRGRDRRSCARCGAPPPAGSRARRGAHWSPRGSCRARSPWCRRAGSGSARRRGAERRRGGGAAGPPWPGPGRAPAAARGTAKGMILTVAAISPGARRSKGGRVASVIASSSRLSASRRGWSTTSTPLALAIRLARPVKGAATAR